MGDDPSLGWEGVARTFIEQAGRSTIGADALRRWVASLPVGAALLDVACGPGGPRGDALSRPDLLRYGIDASPTLLERYQWRYPAATVACEAAETSPFFARTFDGIVAWGLIFLLPEAGQRALIPRLAAALRPGGRLLFTAPHQAGEWNDLSTGRRSASLGHAAYAGLIGGAGMTLAGTEEDEGNNHYYHAVKEA